MNRDVFNERLLKLARHLAVGNLGVQQFDMTTWRAKTDCGFKGCAIGECPIVFPGQWGWAAVVHDQLFITKPSDTAHALHPCLIDGIGNTVHDAKRFFGLTDHEFDVLFKANRGVKAWQHPDQWRNRKRVAKEIRAFVRLENVDEAIIEVFNQTKRKVERDQRTPPQAR